MRTIFLLAILLPIMARAATTAPPPIQHNPWSTNTPGGMIVSDNPISNTAPVVVNSGGTLALEAVGLIKTLSPVNGMLNVHSFGAAGNGSPYYTPSTGQDDYAYLTNAIYTAGNQNSGLHLPAGVYLTSKPIIINGIRAFIKGDSSWTKISYIGTTPIDSVITITNAPYQCRIEDLEIQGNQYATNALRLDHVAQSLFLHVKPRDCINAGFFIEDSVNNTFVGCSVTQPGLFTIQAPKFGVFMTTNSNENAWFTLICENLNTNLTDGIGAGVWMEKGCNNNVFIGGSQEFVYRGFFLTNSSDNTFENIDMESNFLDDVRDSGTGSHWMNVLSTTLLTIAGPNRMSEVVGGRFQNIMIESTAAGASVKKAKYSVIGVGGSITDLSPDGIIEQVQYAQTDARTGLFVNSQIDSPNIQATLSGVFDPTIWWYRTNAGADLKYWRAYASSVNDWRLEALDDAKSVASTAIRITRNAGVPLDAFIIPRLTLGTDTTPDSNMLTIESTNSSGPAIRFVNYMAATTNVTIRGRAGNVEIINDPYTKTIHAFNGDGSAEHTKTLMVGDGTEPDSNILTLNSTNAAGPAIQLNHVGASTPQRTIRELNGSLQFIDNAYSHTSQDFKDSGDVTFSKTGGATLTLKNETTGFSVGLHYNGTQLTLDGPVAFTNLTASTLVQADGTKSLVSIANQAHSILVNDGTQPLWSTDPAVSGTIYANNYYATGDVSALTFTDRSRAPTNLSEAYAIVGSLQSTNGRVNHRLLHRSAWGTRHSQTNVNGVARIVEEPDQTKRDLSMIVSAQGMVINDLMVRVNSLETETKTLFGLVAAAGAAAGGVAAMKKKPDTGTTPPS